METRGKECSDSAAVSGPLPPLYLERHKTVAPWNGGMVLADRAHPKRLSQEDIDSHHHALPVSQLEYNFFCCCLGVYFLSNSVGVSRWVCAGEHVGHRHQIPWSWSFRLFRAP